MSIDYIRKTYDVPAKKGDRIEYTAGGCSKFGTITGTSGPHLLIKLDGSKHSMPFHPTWELRYLSDTSQDARHD